MRHRFLIAVATLLALALAVSMSHAFDTGALAVPQGWQEADVTVTVPSMGLVPVTVPLNVSFVLAVNPTVLRGSEGTDWILLTQTKFVPGDGSPYGPRSSVRLKVMNLGAEENTVTVRVYFIQSD